MSSLLLWLLYMAIYIGAFILLIRLIKGKSTLFYVLAGAVLSIAWRFIYRWILTLFGGTPPNQFMSIGGVLLCIALFIVGRIKPSTL